MTLPRFSTLSIIQQGELGGPIDLSESGPLGPLWPDGEPDWYKEAVEAEGTSVENIEISGAAKAVGTAKGTVKINEEGTSENQELVMEIDIPDGVSDSDAIEGAKELALKADNYHRSQGGRGLEVSDLEIFEEAAKPAGVPNG